MMKKAAVVAVLALAPVVNAFADHDAGCGAGSMIWAGQKGLVFKVLAATTNGIFGNQTFGMTSGTLGCSQDGVVTAASRVPMFASANLDQLSADMAAGHGETLTALAALYNVADADRSAFYAKLQSSYGSIFARADVTSNEVVAAMEAALKSDARLAHYVA